MSETTSEQTLAKLRFLAEVVVAALETPEPISEGPADARSIPDNASPAMLRVLLQTAIPVLQASRHRYLVEQIEAVLADQPESSGA